MKRIPTHPGEIIKDELDARNLSISRFARLLNVPPGRIGQIVQGKRSVSPDTALRLGRFFGNAPEFWMILQTNHDFAVAKLERGDEIVRNVAVGV